MKLPYYVDEKIKAYAKMSSEDRRALLDARLFDVDPLTCPSNYLPLLANEAGVEIAGLEEDAARAMIAGAFAANLKAGTVGGIRSALGAIGDIRIKEKAGFRFDIDLSSEAHAITPAFSALVTRTAQQRKNERSILDELRLGYLVRSREAIGTGGVGEASCEALPLEGYTTNMRYTQPVAVGSAGEVYAVTLQGETTWQ